MGRLSKIDIENELAVKGYRLVDFEQYENMNSSIELICPEGHHFSTTLAQFRHPSFKCPLCDAGISFKNPDTVPPKNGYRVIAFDQATENFGLSIFDNGKLVFFHLYSFNGVFLNRLTQIQKFVQDIVIKEWKPDFIVCEDIQYQYGAVVTYKILAMLLGIIEVTCEKNNIPHEVVSPNVWRKYAGTCGKNRLQEKQLSVAVVKEKYNIRVNDDVAEAILIGRYGAEHHKPELEIAFGKK